MSNIAGMRPRQVLIPAVAASLLLVLAGVGWTLLADLATAKECLDSVYGLPSAVEMTEHGCTIIAETSHGAVQSEPLPGYTTTAAVISLLLGIAAAVPPYIALAVLARRNRP